jgi:hypothetical protein
MTTLNPVHLDFREEEESLLMVIFRAELEESALGLDFNNPKCPQAGKCDCPKTKKRLGWEMVPCNADLAVRCIVKARMCPNGPFPTSE